MSRAKSAAYGLYDAGAKYLIFKSVSLIFAFTELEKSEYVKRGADPKKVVVVPNGISDDCFENIDPKAFLNEHGLRGKKIVFCVGRLHPNKSHNTLLKAFAEVSKTIPDCSLILVGPDDGHYEKLQGLAKSLGVNSQFRWLGLIQTRGALTAAYRSAACFVMPSLYEPFGLVLVEAMAAAVPVMAANAGGPSEIVKSGENGFLFEPGNASDLANKLRVVLDNPALAKSIGEKGLLRAQEFRFKPILDKIETIYYSLVPNGNK